jgi:hypothetical protein
MQIPATPQQLGHASVPTYTGSSVEPTEPTSSVEPRAEMVVDDSVIHRVGDAAVKRNTFVSRPGYPSGKADLQTHLHVEAWVSNTASPARVWADLRIFAHDGALVRTDDLSLAYARPAGDGGNVFVADGEVFQGTVATPGSVDLKPDARKVHYRLYAEVDGRLISDGLVHRCELRSDSASR